MCVCVVCSVYVCVVCVCVCSVCVVCISVCSVCVCVYSIHEGVHHLVGNTAHSKTYHIIYRWQYAITCILEEQVKRKFKMWSWTNMKNTR